MKNRATFFHTLVVVGGSIAASCGGRAEQPAPTDPGDGDSMGDEDSGDGDLAGDGDLVASTGGRLVGDGDIIIVGTGGASAPGGSMALGGSPLDCPPSQWTCESFRVYCEWPHFDTPGDCDCDPGRPTGPEDCEEGQVFTCMDGTETRDMEHTPTPFHCACVERGDSCNDACGQVTDSYYHQCVELPEPGDYQTILCGCEITVLR